MTLEFKKTCLLVSFSKLHIFKQQESKQERNLANVITLSEIYRSVYNYHVYSNPQNSERSENSASHTQQCQQTAKTRDRHWQNWLTADRETSRNSPVI